MLSPKNIYPIKCQEEHKKVCHAWLSRRKAKSKLPVLNPNAAGIDIGATEIYVAVPPDRDSSPVRRFSTFTEDLIALAEWLRECRVTDVAMESTGVYWIPLFQILEERQFEVCLVNARHVKNVPGRKTDVQDCQGLQFTSNTCKKP